MSVSSIWRVLFALPLLFFSFLKEYFYAEYSLLFSICTVSSSFFFFGGVTRPSPIRMQRIHHLPPPPPPPPLTDAALRPPLGGQP